MGKKGLAGGLLDPVYEGLFGGNTDEQDEKSKAELDAAMAEFDNIQSPGLQPINFDEYEWLGDFKGGVDAPTVDAGEDIVYEGFDPRLADLERVNDSAFNDISTDPRLRDQQTASLDALAEIANSGGHTAADVANLNRIQSEVASADRGRRDAIKAGAAARGMGGSGMELLSMLDSSQAATDRANQGGLDIAGQAQDRALNAMLTGGQLAGTVRGQDFGEQSKVAEANDAIDKFNASNFNSNSQFNAGQVNSAGQFNAGNVLKTDMYNRDMNYDANKTNAGYEFDADKVNTGYEYGNHTGRQDTANANVGVSNKGKEFNQFTLPQTQFDNSIKKATGKASAHNAAQAYWDKQGDREAAKAAGYAGIAGGLGAAALSDEREKTDVSDLSSADIDEFLSAVQPKRFKYKNPAKEGASEGDRVGFMLQDVQGTKVGDQITTKGEDGRLRYDRDNLDGVILAALATLQKKGNAA